MTESMMLALAEGVLLGAMFFGGLWWTVRKGVSSQRPALWFFGSLMLRMSMVLTGLYLISGGRWEQLLVCLFGLTMARSIVTRFTQLTANLAQDHSHASEP